MRSHTRLAIIANAMYDGWWTNAELADLASCNRQLAQHWIHVLNLDPNAGVVVRRRRKHAAFKPYEYRCFPRAVAVRVEPLAVQEQA